MAKPLRSAPLSPDCPRTPSREPVGGKTFDLDFDGGRLSSGTAVVLLIDIDAQLGVTCLIGAEPGQYDRRVLGA